jgi:hypothetical protein
MQNSRHRSKNGLVLIIFVMGLLTLCSTYAYGATIYVPDKYPKIQLAINAAVAGDTVIVRDNTYSLTAALDFKGKAITVKSEHGAAKCILDGQHKTRIVNFHSGEGSRSILSGFTIRNGKAKKGGGIYCNSSSPTITDCTIMANKAYISGTGYQYSYGGGIYCNASSPTIANCLIKGNSAEAHSKTWNATSYGGGIHCDGGAPVITDCVVSDNTAVAAGYDSSYANGGGISGNSSTPAITNVTISNNSASAYTGSQGGGMFFFSSDPSMVNCIIDGNSANLGAGIFFSQSSSLTSLTNCTIVRNTAASLGGGIHCLTSSPSIVNSILWENSPVQISTAIASFPVVSHSDVMDGYEGSDNIEVNPLFVNLAKHDFHLTSTSPCINVGDNTAPDLPDEDKDGDPRISHKIVDMGAYEFQWEGYSVSGTVTSGGVGVAGVAVKLTGTATKSTTTDDNGNYRFSGVVTGSYTVTPSKPGRTFAPVSTSVKVNGEDVNGVDFVATLGADQLFAGFGASGLWFYENAMWMPIYSLNPEAMLYSVETSTLYADFGGSGLWQWRKNTWTNLSSGDPENMVLAGSVLYVDFGASGLWMYQGSTWTLLSTANVENMVVSGSVLYAGFGVYGLWKWDDSVWTQLSQYNPESMWIAGSVLYVGFDAYGLWKWDGAATWTQLSQSDPEQLWIADSVIYVDFGGSGLWKLVGSTWILLSTDNPENLVISDSVVYVDFGASGLWKLSGTTWSRLDGRNPENMVLAESILYVDFGADGLWAFGGGASGSKIDARNPENMWSSGPVLYVDFGDSGLWKRDGAVMTQLNSRNPEILLIVHSD